MKLTDFNDKFKVKYLKYNLTKKLPNPGKTIFYLCDRCGDLLATSTVECIGCSCNNIFIDVDAGRTSFDDESQVKVLDIKKKWISF